MDYDALFPGRFLKSSQFKGQDVNLTIAGIRTEALPSDKGAEKVKGIVAFNETKLELVLNRTNGECFKGMFGRETNDWIGKRVTLYPMAMTDSFTGEAITAIRVRGSPDIAADKSLEVRLARKKPMHLTMKRTATNKKANGANGTQKGAVATPPRRLEIQDEAPTPDEVAAAEAAQSEQPF